MIKVNLLKNRGGSKGASSKTDVADGFDESFDTNFDEEGSGSGGTGKKIVLILVGSLILYAYEWYNIGSLNDESATIQASIAQLDQEINSIKPKIASAKKLQSENEELNKKLNLVRSLGRLRLREIRAIDHLQNIIPEKVWFNAVKFTDTTFEVTGLSANDQELDKLLDGIRENPTFVDVLLSRSIEQKSAQGNMKSFVITSSLSKDL